MRLSTRLSRTLAIAALAVTGSIAVAPAVSASVQGPGDITNPTPCVDHCGGGGGGGGHDGPGDLTTPPPPPVVDPKPDDPGVDQPADQPVVVSQPTFTG
jgi:hypothetical protein